MDHQVKFAQSSAVFFNHTLEFAIRSLHQLGYEGIEIWGGRPHMYRNDLDDRVEAINVLLTQYNMKVCNFIPAQFRYPSILCSLSEPVRRDSVNYIKSAMDNAVKVGSPSVSVCPGMVAFDQDVNIGWKKLLNSFSELDEYADEKNLMILIEPAHRFESNLILTVDDYLRMLDELKSEHFGILLDTGHASVNGEKFSEIIPKCQGLPFHIHFDDNHGDADAHLIPGKGNIDYIALYQALKEFKYSGFLSAELGAAYNMDPVSACEETMSYFKNNFKG